jgi:hypothetical protein
MAEVEQDSSESRHEDELKIIRLHITNIFQELDLLKKKVSELGGQLMETRDICEENKCNIRRHPVEHPLYIIPEL